MLSTKLAVVLFAKPLGGKNTQAEQLTKPNWGFEHLNSGPLLGENEEFRSTISSGTLVSDDLVIHVVDHFLLKFDDFPNRIVFNGFPRTLTQARWLLGRLGSSHVRSCMVHLYGPDDETLFKRAEIRRAEQKREDDDPENLKKRLEEYYRHEDGVLEHLSHGISGRCCKIDGNLGVDDIATKIRGFVSGEIAAMSRRNIFSRSPLVISPTAI